MSPAPDTSLRQTGARAAVLAEAVRWVGTPYHHGAAVRGAGVDCARLLIEVYAETGQIERFDPGEYPPDWHLHRSEERYVETILRYAREHTPADLRRIGIGDVLAWRFGRCFAHGGIYVGDGFVVHAYAPSRIVERTQIKGSMLADRAMRHFSLWD